MFIVTPAERAAHTRRSFRGTEGFMAKDWAKKFYDSKAWKECRDSFIATREAEDGGLCQICRQRAGYIVHHKQWLTAANVTDPDVSLSYDNLLYVCHPCHQNNESSDENLYFFDDSGQIQPL